MPIKSYLAYPAQGRRDALARALGALEGCDALPASTHDVVVLVTDTPDDDAERVLQTRLEGLRELQCLTLVAGLDDPDAVGAALVSVRCDGSKP